MLHLCLNTSWLRLSRFFGGKYSGRENIESLHPWVTDRHSARMFGRSYYMCPRFFNVSLFGKYSSKWKRKDEHQVARCEENITGRFHVWRSLVFTIAFILCSTESTSSSNCSYHKTFKCSIKKEFEVLKDGVNTFSNFFLQWIFFVTGGIRKKNL